MSKHVMMSVKDFFNEALKIIEKAESRGIQLRIMGALGVYVNVMDNDDCLKLYESLGRLSKGRLTFTDLDLVGYRKQSKAIESTFRELGYKSDDYINAIFSDKRLIYYHPNNYFTVDIFFSPLEFNHTIDLGKDPEKGRLKLAYPTLSLADMILLKLQIHEINRKDLVDLVVLLASHELSLEEERGKINVKRIAEVLCSDWGFWYDATNNLKLLEGYIHKQIEDETMFMFKNILETTLEKIENIKKVIDETPKNKEWIKRSEIGTKKRWYNVVEEI